MIKAMKIFIFFIIIISFTSETLSHEYGHAKDIQHGYISTTQVYHIQ